MDDQKHQAALLLRPFWGRVLVVESPVDEEQRKSGLIVPLLADNEIDVGVRRGVVVSVDMVWDEGTPGLSLAEELVPGTVVYYVGGVKINDNVILEISQILALETSE